jgi:endoglycosylceramidase
LFELPFWIEMPICWPLIACSLFSLAVATVPRVYLEARPDRPHAFTNGKQEVIFHGSSAVVKGPPWFPDHSQFSKDISMAKEDFEWMQKLGLNFLRLGVMWPGVEPVHTCDVHGACLYNETYLDQIDTIITMAGAHGVYVMFDMHQDGLSEFFCGEGLPSWAVKRVAKPYRKLEFTEPYPAPYSKFENDSCFYHEKRHQGAKFPTRQACDHHKHGQGWGESTFESAQAYQGLYDNWNGTRDALVAVWAKLAARFKGRTEVVGFNLLNEPFAGDMYHDPTLMVPWPSPTNADRVNLQPTYDKINAAVRAIDEEVLLFIAGVTWGDFGSGFTAAPGGEAYSNRTVLTYHFYEPPQTNAAEQVDSHMLEARRLGTAGMMSESEAISGNYHKQDRQNITDACDAHLQGYADWEWKSFVREGPGDAQSVSQYYEWGAPKTGHGHDWPSDSPDTPPAYFTRDLARTYAPRVAGSHVKMQFNATSSSFELHYDVGTIDPGIATEIFVWPGRYPQGAVVLASASAGSVRVDYDGKARWVRIYPGDGLQIGVRVVVSISKKSESSKQQASAPGGS